MTFRTPADAQNAIEGVRGQAPFPAMCSDSLLVVEKGKWPVGVSFLLLTSYFSSVLSSA